MGFDAAGRRVLVVCAACGFTTLLDNSVLNIAIPALRDSLHADATQVQWMVAGYSLAFGLALVPGGRLGDIRGRKPFFLAGMAIFTVGAALAGSSPTHGRSSRRACSKGWGEGWSIPR
ncbi:MFS transporter [Nonomuraea sp. NPDC049625]|uniref:MFS transporter n=1 Tax=Nonomuraea sp. NPDC049625 TaxID=3155775 RepID=UPI00342FC18C